MTENFYKDLYEERSPLPGKTHHALSNDRMNKVRSLLKGLRPRRVLELGFEDPVLSEAIIADSDLDYVGVDISEVSVQSALRAGINAIHLDASRERLPLNDDSFDVVLCCEVIEHLYDPDFAVDQLKRVLKPGGKMIVTTPNLAAWYNRILLIAGIQPVHSEVSTRAVLGRRLTILGQGGVPVGHIRLFTLEGLKDFFGLHELTLVNIQGYSLEFVRKGRFLERLMSRIPSLASGFIVVLEKQPSIAPREISHKLAP